MSDFFDNFVGIDNILGYHLNGNTEGVAFADNILLRKPIGVGTKSYGFMEAMLHRNIGSHSYGYDGFGTNIGMFANPYLNSEIDPWFMLDESKKKYDNYMSYVNDMYYHGSMPPPNFQTIINNKGKRITQFNDYSALYEEFSRVGAIHQYDIDNIAGAKLFVPNGSTNPNGYDDTRLGVINNFYLNSSLQNSNNKTLTRQTSSYHLPSYGYEEQTVDNSFSVTQGAYAKFGLKGEYGINNGTFSLREGGVIPQSILTGDIIPWSTSDNTYVADDNLYRIGAILGVEDDGLIARNSEDNTRRNDNIVYKTSPFGNFYSLTYSLGLLTASGGKTQEFISKSIFGVDLMSDYKPSLDFKNGNINALKRYSRKKYFATIGSRGTNYIDMMTSIDVGYETNDLSIIRLILNDSGNDNLSTFQTYLYYAEAEGNKEAPFISSVKVNDGTIVRMVQTYGTDDIKSKEDIISYTNTQFRKNKYKTIIGRFHTDSFEEPNDSRVKRDFTSSAVSQYGMSRGRNLLKKNHRDSETNKFHDPYCRVWTYHKQYSKYTDLIRPFSTQEDRDTLDEILKNSYQVRRDRLEYSVKNKDNGLINFTPKKDDFYKKCMFSIENLACRDSNYIRENRDMMGPNGGRIMWFPPYGLSFNENVSTQWNATQFIGRGEKIYSYVDTERSGTLSFQLLIDHPSILNSVVKSGSDTIGDVDDVDSKEQQILRFFAGCEVLSAPKKTEESDNEKYIFNEAPTPIVNSSTIERQYVEFSIFFPYNYTGYDEESPKDAINYLLYSIGDKILSKEDEVYLEKNKKNMLGGYELSTKKGLSCVDKWKEEPTSHITTVYKKNGDNLEEYKVEAFECVNSKNDFNYWGYNVDAEYEQEVFENKNNYLDTNTYKLNNKPNKTGRGNCLSVSFVDFAIFMEYEYNDKREEFGTERGKNILKAMFNEYSVEEIELVSYSIHDKKVADRRNETVIKWLSTNSLFNNCRIIKDSKVCEDKEKYKKNLNSKDAKKYRRVEVSICLKKEVFDLRLDYYDNLNNSIIQDVRNQNTNMNTPLSDMARIAMENINEYERKLTLIENEIASGNTSITVSGQTYNEYEFFNEINKNNSFLRNKILDKVKYFDPAYHSITPEGFNSRLTFLHQCTRQGPTHSARENSNNIRNLSFGAPPICVLRIGDFYNTKIVIDSITMSYDDTTWDLNDEGIGVMPMMAKIDMNFKFIGGSDISGAVSYLQNAVSFNYYANTSIYDNKATIVVRENDLIKDEER